MVQALICSGRRLTGRTARLKTDKPVLRALLPDTNQEENLWLQNL